jgi:hypothetical protein
MGLEGKGRHSPFWVGSIWHKGIELYYREQRHPQDVVREEIATWVNRNTEVMSNWDEVETYRFNEDCRLLLGMSKLYPQFAKSDDNFTVLQTEVNFSVPIRDIHGKQFFVKTTLPSTGETVRQPAVYEGRFDGIIVDKYGDVWLLENKTAKSSIRAAQDEPPGTLRPKKLMNDEQCGSYIWAAQWIYGSLFKGVMYNYAFKKLPIQPHPLKNGQITRDQKVINGTTLARYADAIIEAGQHLEDYMDVLTQLYGHGLSHFFERFWISRNPTEIQEIGLRIMYEVKEMADPRLVPYPNPSPMRCPSCTFLVPCMQMSAGDDWKSTLTANYKPRVSTDVEVPDSMPF